MAVAGLAIYAAVNSRSAPGRSAGFFQNSGQIQTPQNSEATTWHLYCSPKGGCTEAVVQALDGARTSVLVQAYSFTSRLIADALISAWRRGVRVEAILDKSDLHGKGALTDYLAESGLPVSIDSAHAIAHNKVMVIDSETVITGSFNFTVAAEKSNAENMLVIQDKSLAEQYTANWQSHRAHSQLYSSLSKDERLAA